jgi:hypothetical protein
MPKTTDDVVHIGTRSWWDGQVTTLCGQTFAKENAQRVCTLFGLPFGTRICGSCRQHPDYHR